MNSEPVKLDAGKEDEPLALSPGKRRLFALLLPLMALGLPLLLFEIAYRIKSPSHPTRGVMPSDIVGRFDPYLGWAYQPNSEGWSRATGHRVDYRFNAKGWRDKEIPYEKPEGEFRIVLLGDSRTVGFGVDIEHHFSYLMEGYFNQVEVVNLGVGAYGVDQMVLAFEREGVKYDPDLVVLYLPHFGRDRHMHAGRFGAAKPCFILENDQLVLTNSPCPAPPGGFSLHAWLRNHSGLYFMVTNRLKRGPALDVEKSEAMTPEDQAKVQYMALKIFQRLQGHCTEKGIPLVVLNQVAPMHQTLIQHGIRSHFIAAALDTGRTQIAPHDTHPDEAGNGILSWELSRYLVQESLVPASHVRNPVLWGDLIPAARQP